MSKCLRNKRYLLLIQGQFCRKFGIGGGKCKTMKRYLLLIQGQFCRKFGIGGGKCKTIKGVFCFHFYSQMRQEIWHRPRQGCPSRHSSRVLFENRPALYFCKYKENKKTIHVYWIPYLLMILQTLWNNSSSNRIKGLLSIDSLGRGIIIAFSAEGNIDNGGYGQTKQKTNCKNKNFQCKCNLLNLYINKLLFQGRKYSVKNLLTL